MQTKTTKTKSVQDDIDNLKKRREERKAKENRKMALSNANHDTMGKYMDKDYEKMIRIKDLFHTTKKTFQIF